LRCLGAQALGLKVDWRYCFVPPGERAATTPGVVYVDVGGTVAPGIIDHHGREGPGSCSAILVVDQREQVYNHLLSPWLARFEEGRIPEGTVWTPTLVLHHDPDFDALVAAFLVRCLIVDGDLPRHARALAGYALEVDQGRYPLRPQGEVEVGKEDTLQYDRRGLDAVHLAYLAIQSFTGPEGRELPSGEKLRLGFELLECFLEGIAAARGELPRRFEELLPGAPGVDAWRADARFAPFAALLDRDLELFREDFRQGRTLGSVLLPATDGGEAIPVRAFVAAGPPRSVLGKYWVRGAGFPFFICPLGAAAEPGPARRAARRRIVLSLEPAFSIAGRRPNLRGLGFRLERAESAARRASGMEVRRGMPRYGGGYCDNPDPWYDGRGHEWTIVDSPLIGTVLPYDEITALATGGEFWKVPLESGSVYLVWTEPEISRTGGDPAPPAAGLRPFAGMSGTLEALYGESGEEETTAGVLPALPAAPGFRVTERVRRFPAGTCRPLRIVEILGEPGSSLEDLVRHRREILGERLPDFSLARVSPGLHFSTPELIDRLLDELGGGGLRPIGGLSAPGERVFFNGRSLVTSAPAGLSMRAGGPDPDLEILLYGAFLYLTLLRFSERLSDLVPPGQSRLIPGSTRRLREDFLRFEARYYPLEVSRAPRTRALLGEIAAALGLAGLFAKVRSELDRLGEIEERVAAESQRRAEGIIQAALFVLAVSGLLQTIVTFWMWDKVGWWVLWWVAPTVGIFVGLFFWARIRGRSVEQPGRDQAADP
jgi:hypothetical protein